jgi:hypothetical protein
MSAPGCGGVLVLSGVVSTFLLALVLDNPKTE